MSDFSAQQQRQLAAILDRHAAEGSTMRLDEVQGFVLALISGPDPVDVAAWLPEILAEEQHFDDAERAQVVALVAQWAAAMQAELAQNRLPELVFYADETGQTDDYTWCNAYLYALDVAPTDWFAAADDEAFEDLFYPVMVLGGVYDADEEQEALLDIDERERDELRRALPDCLLTIYRYWQARLNKPAPIRREGGKIGRNDPCVCGSGKKYKACCGRQA